MVAEISLDQSVGGFGKEIRVMAVHMHNELANGLKWKTAYTQFWARCYDLCKTHNVDVLMGDFNMTKEAARCLLQQMPRNIVDGAVLAGHDRRDLVVAGGVLETFVQDRIKFIASVLDFCLDS